MNTLVYSRIREHEQNLVPSQPAYRVRFTERVLHELRCGADRLVPLSVPVVVVDVFQVVEVYIAYRETLFTSPRNLHTVTYVSKPRLPVEYPGHGVYDGEPPGFELGEPPPRYVRV